MPKKYLPVHILGMFLCGFVLQFSYRASGGAAWSLLISSLNRSPWELTKPFLLVYIFWSFIELSCHRPHLLHYVCAKILSLHLFCWLSLLTLSGLSLFTTQEYIFQGGILLCLTFSELLFRRWYVSRCRFELFFLPLLLSFILLFSCLLFCSLYPLPLPFF